jgi:hypothetical protein
MTITLTREEAQQVLDALECMNEGALNAEIKLLRARLEQPKPEPVAWMQNDMEHFSLWPDEWHVVPLYTAPPQRKWQGLTAYEIQELHLASPNWGNFACAIEAKLKEKNA